MALLFKTIDGYTYNLDNVYRIEEYESPTISDVCMYHTLYAFVDFFQNNSTVMIPLAFYDGCSKEEYTQFYKETRDYDKGKTEPYDTKFKEMCERAEDEYNRLLNAWSYTQINVMK